MPRLQPNERIAARFRLEHPLGEGGMAVVWAAREEGEPTKRVALKFLKEADAMTRRRLLREARAAGAIDHPGVVTVRDIIEHDSAPVLVMELLEGESLSDLLAREGSLGSDAAAPIFFEAIPIIAAAHAAGIVHRDLKPENIFLPANGGVKVLDFGVAKRVSVDAAAARSIGTQTGSLVGTPMFMSPEQVFGDKDVDHRADIWALGVVSYEALSGSVPTSADNLGEVFRRIIGGSLRPILELKPDLPPELAAIIDRMLSVERSARPSLQEVLEVWARLLGRQAPRLPEPQLPAPTSEPHERPAPAPQTKPEVAAPAAEQLVQSKPPWLLLVGALALAGVVGGIVMLSTRAPPGAPSEPAAPPESASSARSEPLPSASATVSASVASALASAIGSAAPGAPSSAASGSPSPRVPSRPRQPAPSVPAQDLDF